MVSAEKPQVRSAEYAAGEQTHGQGEELRRQDADGRVQVEEVWAEVHQEQPPSQVNALIDFTSSYLPT
jgi:hypothetical protein